MAQSSLSVATSFGLSPSAGLFAYILNLVFVLLPRLIPQVTFDDIIRPLVVCLGVRVPRATMDCQNLALWR